LDLHIKVDEKLLPIGNQLVFTNVEEVLPSEEKFGNRALDHGFAKS